MYYNASKSHEGYLKGRSKIKVDKNILIDRAERDNF